VTEDRPTDTSEPSQAQLDLDDATDEAPAAGLPRTGEPGTNGESKPPDDAPPEVPPPDYPRPESEPSPETTNEAPLDEEDLLSHSASIDDELVEEELSEEHVVEEEDLEEDLVEDEPDEVAFEVEPAIEPEAAPTSVLPTAWPEPAVVPAAETVAGRFQGLMVTPPLVLLASLVTIAFLMFVAIEPSPRWLLLFLSVIAVVGTDGVLRQAWPRPFQRPGDPADTTPYLFLPALAAIAWPMLIEHNVRGYLVLPAALLAGVAYATMLMAQVSSVRVSASIYPMARVASVAAVYVTAFALFSLSYVLEVEVAAAVIAVGVIAAMLGVEVFREGQVDPVETLVFAGVTGVILGEARWAMYYVPVGGYLAGLALLLGFFLLTGLLHSHLTRRLTQMVAVEYAGIAAAGVLLVTIAAQAGLG
jgi:hypothetical protein